MAKSTISLNIFIDPQSKRVLYAEAGNDFIDFLVSILGQSVGTLIGRSRNPETAGSLASLYESINGLNESYFVQKHIKDTVLKPAVHRPGFDVALLALYYTQTRTVFYRCNKLDGSCPFYVSVCSSRACPNCKLGTMTQLATNVSSPPISSDGFVKGAVTYMVMDDLSVKPLSTKSTISLLQKFNVRDVEEKVVSVGNDEAVKLLSCALQSKSVLTDLFFKGVN
ncbi:uncharacterized protein LOC105170877 isoform X1 [Sesamum indicum]|uniref:Uncharacterized protein LOC105170877 isoform X1 n=2 Tax=Sesamum indicum TaxID=4182 RepID=A0A6I9TYA5_SESIN|nr:uncharacterized protein LOC105170877 isoform X1 [Sesamum indicum]